MRQCANDELIEKQIFDLQFRHLKIQIFQNTGK